MTVNYNQQWQHRACECSLINWPEVIRGITSMWMLAWKTPSNLTKITVISSQINKYIANFGNSASQNQCKIDIPLPYFFSKQILKLQKFEIREVQLVNKMLKSDGKLKCNTASDRLINQHRIDAILISNSIFNIS